MAKVVRINGMHHYMELSLLEAPEIPLHFLWRKAYQQLHLAFVGIKNEQGRIELGVSFPEYGSKKRFLGSKLRIFSQQKEQLEQLDCSNKLAGLSDYLHLTQIRQVPENIRGYACFKRVQSKSSNARLARRRAKRHSIRYEAALGELSEHIETHSLAPFIQIESLSNQNKFPLFIQKLPKTDVNPGKFSTYGLSSQSTVPEF